MFRSSNVKMGLKKFIKLLWPFLPSLWLVLLALVLVISESTLSLIVPLVTMEFVDDINANGLNTQIIIALACVFLAQLIIHAFALYSMIFIGQSVVLSLRETVWDKILHLPITFFDFHSSGGIMSRMTNDTLIIKQFITTQFIPFISGVISIIGSILLLLIIDWRMTFLMLSIVPVIMGLIIPLGRKMYKVARSLQDETALFQGDLGRVLTNIRLVKSSLAENQERKTGLSRIFKLFLFGKKEGKIMAVIQPVTMSLMFIMLFLIFGYGSIRVAEGTLSAGALVAIIFYLFQLSVPFTQLSDFYAHLQKAIGSSERLDHILSTKSELNHYPVNNYTHSNENLLFHNVSFSYTSDKPILKGLNFEIKVGDTTAFVGPSGAGKTTLFSLLERFYEPYDGEITYIGNSIYSHPLPDWRHRIAYVSQDSPMMSGTIQENLIYGMENVPNEKIAEAVYHANAEELIRSLPNQYNTEVGEGGVRLSGGQRQRIAIARAMIRDPEILLLDEATAHLDSVSEKLVQEALETVMSGRTTLIIAHRLATIKHADQIIIIEDGLVTGKGTHTELIQTHSLYKDLVNQQRTHELVV